jgi:hypothetical protein
MARPNDQSPTDRAECQRQLKVEVGRIFRSVAQKVAIFPAGVENLILGTKDTVILISFRDLRNGQG